MSPRVLVRYSPRRGLDSYDGTRLRKNLKNALEEVGIETVDSLSELPHLVHFLSPIHAAEAVDLKALGTPTATSALYAENDPEARFYDYDEEGKGTLSKKARVLLAHSDLIFVPSAFAENLLRKDGVTGDIKILPPPTHTGRYLKLDEPTSKAFERYFMVRPGHEHVFAKGDYDDKEGLKAVEELSTLLPDLDFYFFGLAGNPRKTADRKHKLNAKTPNNLRFCDSGSDDLYRSGLSSAAFYLSLSYRHSDPIGTYEAFAARIQVFRLGPSLPGDPLERDEVAYGCLTPEELALKATLYRQGALKPTIISAAGKAAEASLPRLGEALKEAYGPLLSIKGE